MDLEPKALFVEYFSNDPDNLEAYFEDCYSLIVGLADDKGIEFDGYLKEKWEISADTIVDFDEEYFENFERKKLFVYLACLYDEEIYNFLKQAYDVANILPPDKGEVKKRIDILIKKGVNFDM